MIRFQFTARGSDGQQVTGEIIAPDQDAAARRLQGAGVYVTSLSALKPVRHLPAQRRVSLSPQEHLLLLESLAMFLEAGVPVQSALLRLRMKSPNPSLRLALDRIQKAIDGGASFTEAVRTGRILPPSWVAVLAVAERRGDFAPALRMLHHLAVEADRFKRQMQGLFVMPAFLLALITLWLWLFVARVIPSLSILLGQAGGPPPVFPLIKVAAEQTLLFFQLGICVFGTGWLLSRWTRRADREMGLFQSWLPLWVPMAGPLVAQLHLIVIASGLKLQLEAGVPMVQALETLSRSVIHRPIRQDLVRAMQELQRGTPVPQAFSFIRVIPPMGRAFFSVGEISGKIPELLEFIVRETQAELMERLRRLVIFARSFLSLVSALLVGFLVILFFRLLFSGMADFGQGFSSRPSL